MTIHGTLDYGLEMCRDSNYSKHRECPICGEPISNRARYCQEHYRMARSKKVRDQIARLIARRSYRLVHDWWEGTG